MVRTMKENSYIVIQGWMLSQLKLSGTELILFALIYGFSQDGVSCYEGSVTYLEEWTGASRSTVYRCLDHLQDRGYISKTERSAGYNEYRAIADPCSEATEPMQSEFFFNSVGELTQEDLNRLTDAWNSQMTTLHITDIKPMSKRYDELRILMKDYTVDEICDTFRSMDEQGWFQDRASKGSTITFKWAISNFQEIVEGNYAKKFLKPGEIDWDFEL